MLVDEGFFVSGDFVMQAELAVNEIRVRSEMLAQ
jgi:hypothetical protein